MTRHQVLKQVESVNMPIPDQYPSLFKGLGTFPEIKLKQDAQPFVLFTPKSAPLPMRKKVEEELARMESLNMISRVDEPTLWCTAVVVAQTGASEPVRLVRPWLDHFWHWKIPLSKIIELFIS